MVALHDDVVEGIEVSRTSLASCSHVKIENVAV
jgi:hypothetical protein